MIEPAIGPLSARLDRPEDFEAFLAIQAARLYALAQGPDPFPGLRRAFLDPFAGSQILWALILARRDDVGEVRLSLSDAATRFEVTHLHVRRLLKRADEEGLIIYYGHGRLSLTPEGARMIELFYAFQLSEIIECGRAMQAER